MGQYLGSGIDIHATRGPDVLLIEAKGVTSSKKGSARFGVLMTGTQFFIQVAAALLKAAELRSANPSAKVAIAVPDHSRMKDRIGKIEPALTRAAIGGVLGLQRPPGHFVESRVLGLADRDGEVPPIHPRGMLPDTRRILAKPA